MAVWRCFISQTHGWISSVLEEGSRSPFAAGSKLSGGYHTEQSERSVLAFNRHQERSKSLADATTFRSQRRPRICSPVSAGGIHPPRASLLRCSGRISYWWPRQSASPKRRQDPTCAVKPSTSTGSDLNTGADPKDIFPAKLSDSLVSSCLLIHFGTIVINLSSVPIHFVLALVLDMFCKLLFSWN
ncbi:uncharacterized protein LOC120709374 isoform X2 [Panicum virgatum]|uniref:uncharacterized protein LOC120709374 isoform X2 n=1 Tax=Panicum virgatum TaxID=38727 RepID=UPI0019D6A852|nr:uncharacterized protein LOC120709374 isoform X2 [Panicum virgatum]